MLLFEQSERAPAFEPLRSWERISTTLVKRGVTGNDCDRLRMAFGEAFDNALRHGSRRNGVPLGRAEDGSRILDPMLIDPEKRIHVRVHMEDLRTQDAEAPNACVRIEVEDEGPGFDPATVPDPIDEANLERPDGRGLLIMRHFASSVNHENGGRCAILSTELRCNVDRMLAAQEAPPTPEAPASPREPRE